MRARLALQRAEIKSELREVVFMDRPEHMMEISPKGTVPVMLLQDGTLLKKVWISWTMLPKKSTPYVEKGKHDKF